MKIAIIYPRFTGPYGGERLLVNLARNLQDVGISITVFTHSANSVDARFKMGLKIVEGSYLKVKNHQIATLIDLFFMPLLVRRIKGKFDILLPVGWQSVFGAYLYKKFSKNSKELKMVYYCLEPPRFIYDLREDTIKQGNLAKKAIFLPLVNLVSFLDKVSVLSTDGIIAISEWTASQVKAIYARSAEVIYPGVEIERFNKFSKKEARGILKIPMTRKVFLSVSKLHRRKRLDLALKVFQKEKNLDSTFFIIGDGPDKRDIENKIEKINLNNIKLLGSLADQDVALYMKASDYFIFTAKNEPFGIAPLEAKISGCKIIPNRIKNRISDWHNVALQNKVIFNQLLNK